MMADVVASWGKFSILPPPHWDNKDCHRGLTKEATNIAVAYPATPGTISFCASRHAGKVRRASSTTRPQLRCEGGHFRKAKVAIPLATQR